VGEVRNAYTVLARKLQAKRLLDPGVDGRIMGSWTEREWRCGLDEVFYLHGELAHGNIPN
jgi:hypothetical protein